MRELAIIFGVVFMLVCFCFVFIHIGRARKICLIDWTILAMAVVYGGGWAFIIFSLEHNEIWEDWITASEHLYLTHTLSAFVLLGSTYLGWSLIGPNRFTLTDIFPRRDKPTAVALVRAAWLLLALAITFQWLYSYAYGGFLGILDHSDQIRSGSIQIQNSLSMLRPFAGLSLFSSFLFFGLLLNQNRRIQVVMGFVISFSFSIYILYSWLGRLGFLVYLTSFLFAFLSIRQPKPFQIVIWGVGLMVAMVVAAYSLSQWFGLKGADNLVEFVAREISFPFVSFFAQLRSGEHLSRGFIDFIVAPIYLLPSSWWLEWGVPNVGQVNTELIMGAAKGEEGVSGAIPVDIMTLGLMQAGVLGIAVTGILFGVGLHLIQKVLDGIQNPGIRAIFEAYVALKVAILAVFYAHPLHVVSGNFALLLSVAIIWLILRMPIKLYNFRNVSQSDKSFKTWDNAFEYDGGKT